MTIGLRCLREHHDAVKLLSVNLVEVIEAFQTVKEFHMVDELFNATGNTFGPDMSTNVIGLFIALFQYNDIFERRIYTIVSDMMTEKENTKSKKSGVLLKLLYAQLAAFSGEWSEVKSFFNKKFIRGEVTRVAWMPKDLQVFVEAHYLYEEALYKTVEGTLVGKDNANFREGRDKAYQEALTLLSNNVEEYPGYRPEQFFIAHIIRDRALAWPRPTYTLEETQKAKEIALEGMKYKDIVPITKAQ